jgi:hypothetical protein
VLEQRNLHIKDKDDLLNRIGEVELKLRQLKEDNERLTEERN